MLSGDICRQIRCTLIGIRNKKGGAWISMLIDERGEELVVADALRKWAIGETV